LSGQPGPPGALIVAERLSHWYGDGALRTQVLFDVDLVVEPGEIVILTGPSGSGKTTLLALAGALRSVQEGRLSVLGHELRGAGDAARKELRRRIGYIFQGHNLVEALTAAQNVEMSLALYARVSSRDRPRLAREALESVGLGPFADRRPAQLSGGQKQRVAIARALASSPSLVLADEPTASLDKQSGRDVVEKMEALARRQGAAVLLVTHDNRILDLADRLVHLEDGRLTSFTAAVALDAQRMLEALGRTARGGELLHRVQHLPPDRFRSLLEEVTAEFKRLLQVMSLVDSEALPRMLDQVLQAFTWKIGDMLRADRASLFVVDRERGELWSKVTREGREIRIPTTAGIAGHTATTGEALNIPDAYASPLFNPAVDRETGYRTRSILCMPLLSADGRVFAVMQLLNKSGGEAFGVADEEQFRELADQMGVILETWVAMAER